MDEPIRFFSPQLPVTVGHNRLPHWDQQGRAYSLMFRLADSIPAELLREHRLAEAVWIAAHPEPHSPEEEKEYLQRFAGQIERWADLGYGECHLCNPKCAEIVAGALRFFEGKRTRLHAWVVMPNHVHVLTEIIEGNTLEDLMESWKGFMSREINAHLGRVGTFSQKGYFDRLIRDWEHFGNVVRYFRQNPIKARLKQGEYLAGESALAQGVAG